MTLPQQPQSAFGHTNRGREAVWRNFARCEDPCIENRAEFHSSARISSHTAVFEHTTASHAIVSSNP